MEIHHVFLGLLFFCVFLMQSGFCILCFECNSEYDKGCADPFLNHTLAVTDCDQRFHLQYPKLSSTVCRKTVQKVNDDYRVIRICGFIEDDKTDCYRRTGTFQIELEYCQCYTDYCNHATVKKPGAHSIVAAAILLLAYQMHSRCY